MNRSVRSIILYMLMTFVWGCGSQAPTPLAGAAIGGPFTLIDQDGRTVTDRDFAGKYRIVYFGYTYCPDVCPTDVANIARGVQAFAKRDAAQAQRIQPIFISVDPARDTPAVLKPFVRAFDPKLIGLTGSPEAIAAVAKAYGVAYQLHTPNASGAYLVDHSRAAYLMGPDDKPIALLSQEGPADKIADELSQWVK